MTSKELRIRELERAAKVAAQRLRDATVAAGRLTQEVYRIRMPNENDVVASVNCGAGSIAVHVTCGGADQAFATVSVTGPGGFTASGTTNFGGLATFSIVGYPPGSYTITVTFTGWATLVTAVAAACATNTANVAITRSPITVLGHVTGCAGRPLVGATVSVYDGATLLNTGLTNSTGDYSLSVASANRPLTVTATKARFAASTGYVANNCVNVATVNIALTPTSSYACVGCTTTPTSGVGLSDPVPLTLHWTPDAGTGCSAVTLTYNATDDAWEGNGTFTGLVYTQCTPNAAPPTAGQTKAVAWQFPASACVMKGTGKVCPADVSNPDLPIDDTITPFATGGVAGAGPSAASCPPLNVTFDMLRPDHNITGSTPVYHGTLTE